MLPDKADILFSGDVFVRDGGRVDRVPEAQHLGCFAGGMFLLGGRTFGIDEHVGVGERLARGCSWAYGAFPTGLMPEISGMLECPTLAPCEWDEARWREQGDRRLRAGLRNARDPRYILRPEAIESIFYLYRVTGREELRDVAWTMFQSIVKATETPIAYSAISDIRATGETEKVDSMEVRALHSPPALPNLLPPPPAPPGGIAANTVFAELLDGRDTEVLLLDLLAARSHQSRRVGSQHGSAPVSTPELNPSPLGHRNTRA